MQVGTMSFSSDHPHKEYGGLYEWDDTTSKLTGSSSSATAAAATQPPPPLPEQRSRSPQLRRLSSARRYSEMSMDLCDLQDWLDEEGEDDNDDSNNNGRIAYNNYSISTASDHTYNQNQLDCVQETDSDGEDLETDSDDDDDDDGFAGSGEYSNYRGRRCRGVHSSNLKLDGIPDDCFQKQSTDNDDDNDDSDDNAQQQPLPILNEQEQEDGSSATTCCTNIRSRSSSCLSSSSSSAAQQQQQQRHNNKKQVQFAATARLEEIQEFETPDNEDYHLLWYTAHELQKMIDGRRVEESIERNNNIVR